MGPVLRPIEQKYASRLSREKKLMRALIDGLPPFTRFRQKFVPTVTNWLPFFWAGFEQSTNYTYRFEDLTNLDEIWKGMTSQLRGHVRASEKAGVRIEERDDIELFITMVGKSYGRQGRAVPTPP